MMIRRAILYRGTLSELSTVVSSTSITLRSYSSSVCRPGLPACVPAQPAATRLFPAIPPAVRTLWTRAGLATAARCGGGCDGERRRGLAGGKAEVRVGEGYIKGQEDPTTILEMVAPFGHEENATLAAQIGIFKVFEYEDGGRLSRITVAFQHRAAAGVGTVAEFAAADNAAKLLQVPKGHVSGARLPDEVTAHFTTLKVPFEVHVFESHTEGVSDSLALFLATPGGFWTVAWHVPAALFRQEPDLFFLFLQTVRLVPRDLPAPPAPPGRRPGA